MRDEKKSSVVRGILALIAVTGLGVFLGYVIPYMSESARNAEEMEALAGIHRNTVTVCRDEVTEAIMHVTPAPAQVFPVPSETVTVVQSAAKTGYRTEALPEVTGPGTEPAEPGPTPDRMKRYGAVPYTLKQKVELDPDRILDEMAEVYALNPDLVGWLTIPGTNMDYPVVQPADEAGMQYYLDHDFYGKKNKNGVLIMDCLCDAYTPSYNLLISGHHLSNGQMFSHLTDYAEKSFWQTHPVFTLDTLMEHNTYLIFAVLRSAKWAENESGFRYQANFATKYEFEPWLEEVRKNQIYETGVDVCFGDECVTLTTCNRTFHREGRFVVAARKLREGEQVPWTGMEP